MMRMTREEKRIRAGLTYQFRLKQRLEYIDFEYNELNPQVDEYLRRATMPALPSLGIEVVAEDVKVAKRAARKRKA